MHVWAADKLSVERLFMFELKQYKAIVGNRSTDLTDLTDLIDVFFDRFQRWQKRWGRMKFSKLFISSYWLQSRHSVDVFTFMLVE